METRIRTHLVPAEIALQQDERAKANLAAARQTEKEAAESRGAVERLEKDQESVRLRLRKLIDSLEAAEKG